MAKSFKELIVWQKAMDLTVSAYALVKFLPKEETYALSDQIRRAAVSIPSNIAEGHARQTSKEFQQFLRIACGSRAELETQLLIAKSLGYFTTVPPQQLERIFQLSDEVSKMLHSLIANC